MKINYRPGTRKALETRKDQKARLEHAMHLTRERGGMVQAAINKRVNDARSKGYTGPTAFIGAGWYGGSVPPNEIARRRRKGKAQRAARKVHRR